MEMYTIKKFKECWNVLKTIIITQVNTISCFWTLTVLIVAFLKIFFIILRMNTVWNHGLEPSGKPPSTSVLEPPLQGISGDSEV